MNQFLIDGITYRAVYRDNPNGFGEERGGCCLLDGSNFTECEGCSFYGHCPADAEDDIQDAEAREAQLTRDVNSLADGEDDE